MIDKSKIKTDYEYHQVIYNNTNTKETLEWSPEFDIEMTDSITKIKIITDKKYDEVEFLISISEGVENNKTGLKEYLLSQGVEEIKSIDLKNDSYLKANPRKLTHHGAHRIIQKLKSNNAPEQIWQYSKEKLGCSVFCENNLSSKNIHLLFSGYMRNIQAKIKNKNIPNEIQSIAISYGIPGHQ